MKLLFFSAYSMTRQARRRPWRGLPRGLRVGGAPASSAKVGDFGNPGLVWRKTPRDFFVILV